MEGHVQGVTKLKIMTRKTNKMYVPTEPGERVCIKSEPNLKTLDLGKSRNQCNASGQPRGVIELTGKELLSCSNHTELLDKVQFFSMLVCSQDSKPSRELSGIRNEEETIQQMNGRES